MNVIETAIRAGFSGSVAKMWESHFTEFSNLVRNEVMDECIKKLSNEIPAYYVYRVNGLRWNSSAERPHEDDYDEGTLIPLYTR